MLVHIDQAGRHGAPTTVNDVSIRGLDGFAHFFNVVVFYQHTHTRGKLVFKPVKNIDVGKQNLVWFSFFGSIG